MGWARRLPSGKWQGQYRKPGHGRKGFSAGTFKTEKQAVKAADKIEQGLSADPALAKITLRDFAYEHVLDLDNYQSANTHIKDLGRFRTHIEPNFGDRPLGSIRALELRQWITVLKSHSVKANGQPLAAATIRQAYWLFSKIMDLAVEGEFIISTPFVKSLQRALPSIPPPKKYKVSVDDVIRIADTIHPRFRAAVLTIGMLGLRFSEMAGLRREDLHLDELHPRIEIVGALKDVGGHQHWEASRKNGEGYSLPLPPPLVAALRQHLKEHAKHETYVFCGQNGATLRKDTWASRHFKPAANAAGLLGLSPHKMRHACVATLIDLGVHPRVISDWIGDSTVRMVLETYGSSSDAAHDEVAARLGELYAAVQPNVQPLRRIADQGE